MSFGGDILKQTLITTISSIFSLLVISIIIGFIAYFIIMQIKQGLPTNIWDLIGI